MHKLYLFTRVTSKKMFIHHPKEMKTKVKGFQNMWFLQNSTNRYISDILIIVKTHLP